MLEKVYQDRLAKLEKVRSLGFDPYGGRYDSAEAISSILARFKDEPAAPEGTAAAAPQAGAAPAVNEAKAASQPPHSIGATQRADAAGRLVLIRDMGKMMFAHIRDQTGAMQIALRKNVLDEKTWELAKCLDLGDIVAVEGLLHRTRTGEITIFADRLTLLCKSLLPMPEKFHGLQDVQTRYRQRYLDLMANKDSLDRFFQRAKIIELFRERLRARGFVEVETPILQAQYGGAAARPFTTHHNTLDADLFLRISPELFLKRLLVGGMQKVFEIGRNFRNEGIDTRHNPEFTMMELYQAYADYEVMMEITEELVSVCAEKIACPADDAEMASLPADTIPVEGAIVQDGRQVADTRPGVAKRNAETLRRQGRLALAYGERVIDYTTPWPRLTYESLLKECAGVDMRDEPAVRAKARALGIEESNKDVAVVVNEVFERTVEPELAKRDRPTFVKDYPAALCPLTRRKADDPSIALRFECFIAGMEIANAYTELNDPAVQEANFAGQLKGEGDTMRVMDEDFVTALRHGMPPAGGLGIGIDRVIMLLTNTQSIRDVVLFPMLRKEADV